MATVTRTLCETPVPFVAVQVITSLAVIITTPSHAAPFALTDIALEQLPKFDPVIVMIPPAVLVFVAVSTTGAIKKRIEK